VADAQDGTLLACAALADVPVAVAPDGSADHMIAASGPALVRAVAPAWQSWLPASLVRWVAPLHAAPTRAQVVPGRVRLVTIPATDT
jgi:hypothetical protein